MKKKTEIVKELKKFKSLNKMGIMNYDSEIDTLEWVLK